MITCFIYLADQKNYLTVYVIVNLYARSVLSYIRVTLEWFLLYYYLTNFLFCVIKS